MRIGCVGQGYVRAGLGIIPYNSKIGQKPSGATIDLTAYTAILNQSLSEMFAP